MPGQTIGASLGTAAFACLLGGLFRYLIKRDKKKEAQMEIEKERMGDWENKIDQAFLDEIGGKKRRA